MNKREKELAALYISGCMDDMRIAQKWGDTEAAAKAEADFKSYHRRLKEMLESKFELFNLDYEKSVLKPIQEINKIALVFYSQRVNGQELKYPA